MGGQRLYGRRRLRHPWAESKNARRDAAEADGSLNDLTNAYETMHQDDNGTDRPGTNDLQAFARRVFAAQPFSQFLGAELTACRPGTAELKLPVEEHLTQQHGFVHGGVISYLADNSLTFAGGLALGGNALTSEFKINYLRPARGTHLIARAEAKSRGKRQAVCQCEVFATKGDEETLCALAQGTVVAAS